MNPAKPTAPQYVRRAAELVYDALFAAHPPDSPADVLNDLQDALQDAGAVFSAGDKQALWSRQWRQRSPPDLVPRLLTALAEEALIQWALNNEPRAAQQLGKPALREKIAAWLAAQPEALAAVIRRAAIDHRLGLAGAEDNALIRSLLGPALSSKEAMMDPEVQLNELVDRLMQNYYYDVGNGLPDDFNDEAVQKAYARAVGGALRNLTLDIGEAANDSTVAAIIGMLLLIGRTQTDSSGFEADVRQAWTRLFTTETGNAVQNAVIYRAAEAALRADRPGQKLSFQEVASVGDALSTAESRVPPDNPNFAGLVRVAAQDYLARRAPLGGLGELPPLTGDSSDDTEIEPDNIRAVAWVYAAYQYEQVRLFDVVDRIAELFMNGMLPIGLDSGGQALDRYYWDAEDRLSTAARFSHYGRVLGAPGADVSREVQPNGEFNNLWLRFLASLAEFDRQQRMADLLQQRRGLATTGEHVRKAGRDLAANVSLYGWAATHFIARRLEKQIRDTIGILRLPSIQKAYAVQSPWQVIERVTAMEFGQTPNIVRHDTMARSGKKILDLVAKHHRVWGSTSGRPLFTTGGTNNVLETIFLAAIQGGQAADDALRQRLAGLLAQQSADIPLDDQNTFMNETQYWLAVNGITDDEVNERSRPALTPPAPSIPTAGGSTGGGNIDQLRQMISQGQMPSMDQLQRIVGVNGGGL